MKNDAGWKPPLPARQPDRPPVALWRHWPGDDQDAAALATAHLKWQRDYDWDVLKVSPASSYSVVDWGVVDRWEGHIEGTRVYVQTADSHRDRLVRLTAPRPDAGHARHPTGGAPPGG